MNLRRNRNKFANKSFLAKFPCLSIDLVGNGRWIWSSYNCRNGFNRWNRQWKVEHWVVLMRITAMSSFKAFYFIT